MKGSVLVTAAVVGLLSAGAAHAQTTTTQSGTTIVPNTGINVVPNTLSTPNGFVPGSTFVPGTGFVAPDGTLLDGFGTFSPGFYPGFYPGYTTGYFNPYGYNPYFNQTYDTSYSFDQSRYSAFRPRMMSTVVPTLGINTPPLRPGYRTARVPGPRLSGTTVRQRVAGSRQETTGTEYVNLISPQQV